MQGSAGRQKGSLLDLYVTVGAVVRVRFALRGEGFLVVGGNSRRRKLCGLCL